MHEVICEQTRICKPHTNNTITHCVISFSDFSYLILVYCSAQIMYFTLIEAAIDK